MVDFHGSEENYSLTDITILNEIQAYSTIYDQTGTFNQLLINYRKNSTDENTTVTDQSSFNWDQSVNLSKQDRYLPPKIEVYIHRRHRPINYQPKSKEIHIEYDQINVKIEKEIRQRSQIKCIDPDEYIRQHGSTLYSPQAFRKIFQKIIS